MAYSRLNHDTLDDPRPGRKRLISDYDFPIEKKPFAKFGKWLPVLMLLLVPAVLFIFVAKLTGILLLVVIANFIVLAIIVSCTIMVIISTVIGLYNYRKQHRS